MSAGHGLSPRVIRCAAVLAERFQNPDVAAYGRDFTLTYRTWGNKRRSLPRSPRQAHFWFCVGRALTRGPGCWTDYEVAVHRDIQAARLAIRGMKEAA